MKTKKQDPDAINGTIVEHLAALYRATENAHRWLRRSEAWRAIHDHVVYAENCVLVDRKGRRVSCHRGTGYAVRIKDAFNMRTGGPSTICIVVQVEYDEDDEIVDSGATETERIYVPADMLIRFSRRKFNAWLKIRRAEALLARKDRLLRQINMLIAQFPEATKALQLQWKK